MGDYNREIEEQQKGLYPKYTLINNETGEQAEGGYFILKPLEDPAAVKALLAYTDHTHNKLLANDIRAWLVRLGVVGDVESVGKVIKPSCPYCGSTGIHYCTKARGSSATD